LSKSIVRQWLVDLRPQFPIALQEFPDALSIVVAYGDRQRLGGIEPLRGYMRFQLRPRGETIFISYIEVSRN